MSIRRWQHEHEHPAAGGAADRLAIDAGHSGALNNRAGREKKTSALRRRAL